MLVAQKPHVSKQVSAKHGVWRVKNEQRLQTNKITFNELDWIDRKHLRTSRIISHCIIKSSELKYRLNADSVLKINQIR